MPRDRAGIVLYARAQGRVLLMHRIRGGATPRDYWVIPGGGVEAGESFEQAARRELREEVDLETGALTPLPQFQGRYGIEAYFLSDTGRDDPCTIHGPEAAKDSAGNQHLPTWVDVADLPRLNLLPPEAKALLIDTLRP